MNRLNTKYLGKSPSPAIKKARLWRCYLGSRGAGRRHAQLGAAYLELVIFFASIAVLAGVPLITMLSPRMHALDNSEDIKHSFHALLNTSVGLGATYMDETGDVRSRNNVSRVIDPVTQNPAQYSELYQIASALKLQSNNQDFCAVYIVSKPFEHQSCNAVIRGHSASNDDGVVAIAAGEVYSEGADICGLGNTFSPTELLNSASADCCQREAAGAECERQAFIGVFPMNRPDLFVKIPLATARLS